MRIAAWSGPRNISTALMRSFEARGDCAVVDEPLYAAFLAATGKDHPGRDEILVSQPTDPADVLDQLRTTSIVRPAPPVQGLVYEKHMAHHWQPSWPWERFGEARHLLLIRDPERVVASYTKVREAPVPEDLGLLQQVWLLDRLADPLVVDGDELLADPSAMLARICRELGIPYTDRMLSWPPGRRVTDGVWAPHWYAAVEASTGFGPPSRGPVVVPDGVRWVVDAVRPAYERLAARRIRATAT